LEEQVHKMSIAVGVLVLISAGGTRAQQQGGDMKAKMAPVASPAVQTKIRQAMQAAPPEISAHAMIMDWPETEGGPMMHLRAGTNGWTCMPSSPAPATGAAREDPMCADTAFSALLEAWTAKSEPRLSRVAIAYMLRGDKGASNTDPFAMAPTADNQWIVSPAHIMVAVPSPQQLDGFPTDPHAGGPWIMWQGTKYAHLMIPTAPMATPMANTKSMSDK
jgi:hypothetical protein